MKCKEGKRPHFGAEFIDGSWFLWRPFSWEGNEFSRWQVICGFFRFEDVRHFHTAEWLHNTPSFSFPKVHNRSLWGKQNFPTLKLILQFLLPQSVSKSCRSKMVKGGFCVQAESSDGRVYTARSLSEIPFESETAKRDFIRHLFRLYSQHVEWCFISRTTTAEKALWLLLPFINIIYARLNVVS